MHKWGIWAIALTVVFFVAILSANPAKAASIETDFPFQVVCTTGGQLCDPPFSVDVQTDSELSVKYTVTGHCSSIRVHVFLDGNPVRTSEFFGWVLSSPPPPFDVLPLMTPIIDLGPVTPGIHQVSLQGEGQVSGCNSGALGVWTGTLTTFTNDVPEPDIHQDIFTEVQNIEEKLDGDRPSLITQIVDALTSMATDIGNILSILDDDETGLVEIKREIIEIETQVEKLDEIERKLDELSQSNQDNTILMALRGFEGISDTEIFQLNSIQHHVGAKDKAAKINDKAEFRIKVCEGKADENSSCWIRIAAPYSSSLWGSLMTPRIGNEVLVTFIEGDPDRPLVVGAVYKDAHVISPEVILENNEPPEIEFLVTYGLNEIIFDDQKGEETFCFEVDAKKKTTVECSSDLEFSQTPQCDDLGGKCKAWAACVNSGDQILSWSACPDSQAVCCGPPIP